MPDRIGNGNLLQCCTMVEHSGADFRDALRQSNTSQGIALIKRLLADLLYSIRNIHTLQLLALKKCIRSDFLHLSWQLQFLQISAACECISIQRNQGIRQLYRLNGHVILKCKSSNDANTIWNHNILRSSLISNQNLIADDDIGFCLCIQPRGMGENSPAHILHRIRNGNRFEPTTIDKCITPDFQHRFRDTDRPQPCMIHKGIVFDFRHRQPVNLIGNNEFREGIFRAGNLHCLIVQNFIINSVCRSQSLCCFRRNRKFPVPAKTLQHRKPNTERQPYMLFHCINSFSVICKTSQIVRTTPFSVLGGATNRVSAGETCKSD